MDALPGSASGMTGVDGVDPRKLFLVRFYVTWNARIFQCES